MMNTVLPMGDLLPCGVCSFSAVGELFSCRAKARIPHNPKSVIVYLFPYLLEESFYENKNISKYAVPKDYHLIVGRYLEEITEKLREKYPHNQFEWFCDNSPVNEVKAAVLCGLGVKGKNGLLINETYGSFCFIGEIITDLETEYKSVEERCCMECDLCSRKCPGNAIATDGININKCLSHITQMKGELSSDDIALIKTSGCIWGCDICQDVCPMNKNAAITPIEEFRKTAVSVFVENSSIEDRAYAWRGRKVIERNLSYFNK